MNIKGFINTAEKFTRNNSSTILTVAGVVGVATTAYFSAKAGFKACEELKKEETIRNRPLDKKESIKHVWKLYIPAGIVGIGTIVSIASASKINNRRAAALTAAYSLTERAFSEYKEKVIETIGDKKEKKVREEIAADKLAANPPAQNGVMVVGSGDILCYELYTGRYFYSDMESIRRAQNTINAKLISEMEATLSDFYYLINIPQTSSSSYSGWTAEKMLDLSFSTLLHDSKPCLAFEYNYVKSF